MTVRTVRARSESPETRRSRPLRPCPRRRTAADAARRRMDDPAYRVDVGAPARARRRPRTRPGASSRVAARGASTTAGTSRRSCAPLADRGDRREAAHDHRAGTIRPTSRFDRSINPYRGCEHGCAYCFARPTHAFQGLSSGLDFETKIFAKPNAAELLEKELRAPGYEPKTIAMGSNTDPYQPVERRFRITRSILEVLDRDEPPGRHRHEIGSRHARHRHPGPDGRPAARQGGDLDHDPRPEARARAWSPARPAPAKRLDTIRKLAEAGIPVTVLVAPIIPAINDHEIEAILKAAYEAGAREAGYVLLRLPHDLKDLMRDWLARALSGQAQHVFSLLQESRGGKDYDAQWGTRQTGVGPFAWMIGRRFETADRAPRLEQAAPEAAHRPVRAAGEGNGAVALF